MRRGYHIRIIVNSEKSDKPERDHPFIPASLFQRLPSHKSSLRRNTLLSRPQQKNSDYRRGPLSIDWTDFDYMSSTISGKEKNQHKGHAEAAFVTHTHTKSGTTNLPEGTVHVFRDGSSRPSMEELENQVADMSIDDPLYSDSDGITLGVLAVPSWMTPSNFLEFIAPAEGGISHLRIIRDFAPNRSIAVVKFPNPADAAEFAEEYNGKPFNSMEPEICHVVHVLSVVIDVEDSLSQAISRFSTNPGTMYELPTCPVCLERMDSAVTGLITVPCSHTFHCMCLSKWGDSRCPVCRYSQTLLSSHPSTSSTRSIPFADPRAPTQSSCSSCDSTTNLWICLICGNIGCGRYGRAHAQAHYQTTTHLYALELETQRVWDYAGDGYVHRLIQNKADGKLVELPSAAAAMGTSPREGGLGPSQADALSAEKIEAIGIEYSYLLTSQLDSQRAFYDEQTTDLKSQVAELKASVAQLSNEFKREQQRYAEAEEKLRKQREAEVQQILKEKTKAENKAEKISELARRLEKELREERAVSEGMMKNLSNLKDQALLAEQEKEEFTNKIQELEDQVRDVMFFLDAKEKIENGGGIESEAAGGSIALPPPSNDGSETPRKMKQKKRR